MPVKKTIIPLLFFLLLISPSPGLCTILSFKAQPLVTGEKIFLADIATIEQGKSTLDRLDNILVAAAPAPGGTKELITASIVKKIQHQLNKEQIDWQGPDIITVTRQAIRLEKEDLHQIIAEFIQDNRGQLPEGKIQFASSRAPSALLLPYGKVTWEVKYSRPSLAKNSDFTIHFLVDDKPTKKCTVRGKIEVLRPVAIARETIRRGTILTQGHFRMAPENILEIDHPIYDPHKLIGMQTVRTLRGGHFIEYDDLAIPPVITKGELVKILAGKGNLKISTSGVARNSGALGDVIRVKNINSNKLIYAKVSSPGIVSVEF